MTRPTTQQQVGAMAAVLCGCCYIIGFVLIIFVIPDFNQDPETRLPVILQHSLLIQLWYLCIFVIFGIALLLLARAIQKEGQSPPSILQQFSTMVGYIWAAYVFASGLIAILAIQLIGSQPEGEVQRMWDAMSALQSGMGDGVEWVGGLWMLLINSVLLTQHQSPKWLAQFGLFVGVAGMLTLLPALAASGAIFGLSQIIWFFAVAWNLPRGRLTHQPEVG